MNYVYATVSYQDGRNIKYADSLGIGRTMGDAENNLKDTLFKYNPKAKPYYNDIYDAQAHHQNYDFELEDVFTELRGLDKHPELMQILLDYLPQAITKRLSGVKAVSDAITESTPNGYNVLIDLQDRDGNKFTLEVAYGSNPAMHVSIFSKENNRYVSDTAKSYPPECPDIKKLLDQYYKHLNNESLTNKRRQPMKRYECSMQKKKESISKVLPKHDWLDAETLEKEITSILDSEGEDIKKDVEGSGDDPYFTELALETIKDSGYYGDLCERIQDDMYKYVKGGDYKIPGNFERINWSWDEDHKDGIKFNELRNKLLNGIDDADTNEFSTWAIDWFFKAFGTFGITYKFRDMVNDIAYEYEHEDNDPEEALKKGEARTKRPIESVIGASKKSEAENPKDVIGDELPYGMMQYRDEETKEWLPILVSINYNDRGWFYEGLAPSDNFGNFSFEEFNRGFLKTCKSGTDKCDQELVNSMKKFFTESSMDIDKMPTKEVTNLTAYIPKGKPYIGKE